ncbi:MAG TPA: GAF domain-containing protein [Burkholderiaceae bacterium]|nr:GAF domain-containing protein [Burkholderiaceae bacterium]
MLDRIGYGYIALDRDLMIRDLSARACEVLGRSRESLLGHPLWEAIPGGAGEALARALRRALADGRDLQIETPLQPAHRWFEMGIYPMADGLEVLFTDVTGRKRDERLLAGQRDLLRAIAFGRPLADTLDAICRLTEAEAEGMLCSVLLLDDDGVHVRHGAAPSLPESYVRAIDGQPIGPQAGSCGTAAYRREAVIVEDIATNPLWEPYRAHVLAHGLRACWSTPIFGVAHVVLGTFAMYYRAPGAPPPQHLQLIDVATQTAAVAIEHERMLGALRALALRLQEVEAAERGALNRELHDRVGQNLSALGLLLTLIHDELPAEAQARVERRLEDAQAVLADTVRHVRDVMAELRPPALDEFGLAAALRTFAERFAGRLGVTVDVVEEGLGARLPRAIETALFRIAQEALSNVAKHARATRVQIRVRADTANVELSVADDGVGFETAVAAPGTHWGMQTMRERAAAIGANLRIESSGGHGTCVVVRLPRASERA